MTFKEWWDKENMDAVPGADFTEGQEVWNAAKRDAWVCVFQIVSDYPHLASRDFIKLLEAEREKDGCGPLVMTARD